MRSNLAVAAVLAGGVAVVVVVLADISIVIGWRRRFLVTFVLLHLDEDEVVGVSGDGVLSRSDGSLRQRQNRRQHRGLGRLQCVPDGRKPRLLQHRRWPDGLMQHRGRGVDSQRIFEVGGEVQTARRNSWRRRLRRRQSERQRSHSDWRGEGGVSGVGAFVLGRDEGDRFAVGDNPPRAFDDQIVSGRRRRLSLSVGRFDGFDRHLLLENGILRRARLQMRLDATLKLGVDVALAHLTRHELVDHLDAFGVARVVVGQHFRLGHGRVDGRVVLL